MSILKNSFDDRDLKEIIGVLNSEYKGSSGNPDIIEDCRYLLSALNGDLVDIARISDKLSNNDVHLRSLIASLITGETKFDSMEEED